MNKIRRLLLVILFATLTLCAKAQLFSLNTDVLMDGLGAPNIGFELVTGNRSSVSANVVYAPRALWQDAKLALVQPEYRYYFSGRPMSRWFLGGAAVAGTFKYTGKEKIYDGFAIGGGITFGYVLNINKRLNVDFHTGFGCIYYNRKEYFKHDNFEVDYAVDGVGQANATGYYLLPTRVGISATYILF